MVSSGADFWYEHAVDRAVPKVNVAEAVCDLISTSLCYQSGMDMEMDISTKACCHCS